VLPTSTQLKIELWRADLLAGLLEVDGHGIITSSGVKGIPGFDAHLLLGVPQNRLVGECNLLA
jgi:hypothetical protein